MAAMNEGGGFFLIVTEVDSDRIESAAKKFASAFSLDATIAQQIAKSAPIVFAQDLSKAEVKAITSTLQNLSKEGIEFRVTSRLAKKVPKLHWPVRPQFTAGGVEGSSGQTFAWNNNAFVCPSCSETFLFRRLGPLPLEEAPSVEAASSPAPAPVRVMEEDPLELEPVAQEASIAAEPELDPMEVEMAEPVDLPEGVEEIDLDGGEEELAAEPIEEIDLGDNFELASESGSAPLAPDETAAPEEEAVTMVEEVALAPTGDLFNVFLSKISDRAKQKKAAALIAEVKGCSPQEATDLASRLVIPLARGVAKNQAEDILSKFKKLKIFGRMTKAK